MTSNRPHGPRPRRVPIQDSILVRYPHLAAEADHARAAAMGLDFWSIAPGTKVRLPWRHVTADRNPHWWLQAGTSRVHMKAGCPMCRGYAADLTTSLAALRPELADEWSATRNGTRTPSNVTPGSRHDAWWSCSNCRFEWRARISSRALDGNGCRRCAGQVALPGDDATLAVAQPELYAELDVRKVERLGIDPLTVHVRSQRALPWQCQRDARHRWTATPAARMNGCVCPRCPAPSRTSSIERRLLELVRGQFPDAVGDAPADATRWVDARGRLVRARCDIVVPSRRLVVEYDGLRYHRSAGRRRCDIDKTTALLADGWRVVRVRERAGTRNLSLLDVEDDRLLQLSHRYGDRLGPLVDEIAAWVGQKDG